MTQEELENTVVDLKNKLDTVLNTISESEDKYKRGKFRERNVEKLSKYEDQLKKLNGDDFDLYDAAYDEYNSDFADVDEEIYIGNLVSEIDNKLAKLRDALGVKEDAEVKVESSDDTAIEVSDEAEPQEEGEKKEEEADTEEEKKEESDDLEAFENDLEAELNKYKKN